jgi:phosphate transport system permease protein
MKNFKHLEESFFRIFSKSVTYMIIALLFFILFIIFRQGLPYLSFDMLTKIPEGGYYFGKEGGILNAIIGSLYLAISSTVLSLLVGVPLALFLNIHLLKYPKIQQSVRFMLDALWGVPSIVYGAFGFTIMVFLNLSTSLLAGIITVTLLIVPIMVRALDESLRTIPKGLLEASFSLGSTKSEISYRIFLKKSIPGLVTAILLSFGRGIGDAASVLFTAGYTDNIPQNLSQPTATLPLAIFFQLSSPIPEVRGRAYAAAVVLTLIILAVSLITRIISKKKS